MELIEAIRTRRSNGRVKPDPVSREVIEQLLEAATWAPSHHNTQPWTFFVMTGEGRSKLGDGYAQIAAEAWPADMDAQEREERLGKEHAKAFRAPVVIAVACTPSDDPRAVAEEELAATNAAVQNLLLAAHDAGLGAIWRSGAPLFHPLMRQAFGLREIDQLVGFVYLGQTDFTPPVGRRTSAAEKTVWLD